MFNFDPTNNVSRRELITIAASTFALATISPIVAKAEEAIVSDAIMIPGSEGARCRWDEAVRQAALQGEPVYYGLDNGAHRVFPDVSRAIGSQRTVSASKNLIIAGLPNTIIISANYGVTSAGKISPFNWAAIYISAGRIISSNYNRAILDGGKTNAIYYHAEIRDVADISTYVDDFYCESYASFTGHFY
jgi:hypothetical protein